jgi:hypothetical protein
MIRRGKLINPKGDYPIMMPQRIAVACMLGAAILTGCSKASSTTTGTSEMSSLPVGGGSVQVVESPVIATASPATPTVEALGVYPPPESATAENSPAPKAANTPGTNSVFLPAIVNEKPPEYPFELQSTGVMAIQGFYGCNWEGVAGQVFDLAGIPIQNLILHLQGFWAGQTVSAEKLSGSASQYGPAGYEFLLGTQTMESTQALWIQVFDSTHKEISARVYLDTYNDCARNLILVNFNQVR